MLGEPGQVRHFRGDANVDRADVEWNGRTTGDGNRASRWVDLGRLAEDEARVGEAAKLDDVDIELFAGGVTRNEAREHAGVGSCGVGVDDG